MKDYCDAINIPDNPRRIASMSSMACSRMVIESGKEPVMQIALRDRNRIALESDLYGAHALGVRNILLVTGDLPGLGSDPDAKVISDIDSIQALKIASRIMEGKNHSSEELEGIPRFHLGATVDPMAHPNKEHVQRMREKCEAGAKFFQTQAVYDTERLAEFLEMTSDIDAHLIAGVIPLRGPEMAEFMTEHVAGITIPDEVVQRLVLAAEGLEGEEMEEASQREGMVIARETINILKKMEPVDGVHIMAVGWESCVPELVKSTGLHPRPR